MATNTYTALATQTLSSAASSVTFSSIPSGYTDLVLVASVIGTSGGAANVYARLNGDTGTNYSKTSIYGSGSSAGSSRDSNASAIYAFAITPANTTEPAIGLINLMNYSNTNTYKTVIGRNSTTGYVVASFVGLWRSTAAINSITLTIDSGNIAAGSTFNLYGIANADIGALATGGIITYDANYYYHTFGASGTFTPKQSLTATAYVVGGGGGGTSNFGGGGGGGGVVTSSPMSLTATGYTVTVGAGGARGYNYVQATDGVASSFNGTSGNPGIKGGNGGSAGGNSGNGYAGGAGYYPYPPLTNGGGGAGASMNGYDANSVTGPKGGDGLTLSLWEPYAVGGGGNGGQAGTGSNAGWGPNTTPYPTTTSLGGGGLGGGGSSPGAGQPGSAYRGGGGGGGTWDNSVGGVLANFAGGAGGSGVVIIRYPRA